jgi:hypothetical protein
MEIFRSESIFDQSQFSVSKVMEPVYDFALEAIVFVGNYFKYATEALFSLFEKVAKTIVPYIIQYSLQFNEVLNQYSFTLIHQVDKLGCNLLFEEKKNSAEYATFLVSNDPNAYLTLLPKHKLDVSIATIAAKKDPTNCSLFEELLRHVPSTFAFASEGIRGDKRTVIEVIKKDPQLFRYCSTELKKDDEVLNIVLSLYPEAIHLIPSDTINTSHIQLALKEKPFDRSFALKLCEVTESTFTLLHPDFQNNSKFILDVLQKNGKVYQFLLPLHLQNKEFAIISLQNDPTHSMIKFIPHELFEDSEFVMTICEIYPNYVQDIPEKYVKNQKLWWKILHQDPQLYSHLPREFQNNQEFIIQAIRNNPTIFLYLNGSMKEKKAVATEAIRQNGLFLHLLKTAFKEDPELILLAVQENGCALQYVSPRLKKEDICLAALRSNFDAIEFIPEALKRSAKFQPFIMAYTIGKEEVQVGHGIYEILPIPEELSITLERNEDESIDLSLIAEFFVDLREFIQSWTLEKKPIAVIAKSTDELDEVKINYLKILQRLEYRLESHVAYLGTPPEKEEVLVSEFYQYVKQLICKIFRNIKNHSEYVEERYLILDGANRCGGALIGELTRLASKFNPICRPTLQESFAAIAMREAKSAVEAITPQRDAHRFNKRLELLHPYIGGQRIIKDHLADDLLNAELIKRTFLRAYTPKKLVLTIVEEIKYNDTLFELFEKFVEEELFQEQPIDSAIQKRLDQIANELKDSFDKITGSSLELLKKQSIENQVIILQAINRTNQLTIFNLETRSFLTADEREAIFFHRKELVELLHYLRNISIRTRIPIKTILECDFRTIRSAFDRQREKIAIELMIERFQKKYIEGRPSAVNVALVLERIEVMQKIARVRPLPA